MPRKVFKFGGESTQLEHLPRIAAMMVHEHETIASRTAVEEEDDGPSGIVVVVAAQEAAIRELTTRARQLNPQADSRNLDRLRATVEMRTVELLTIAIQGKGAKAIGLTGAEAGIVVEAIDREPRIVHVSTRRILDHLAAGYIVVMGGSNGETVEQEISTTDQSAADATAVELARALNADCTICVMEGGIHAADPTIVPDATVLNAVTFKDMLEMSRLGAGAISPRAVEAAARAKRPFRVVSAFGDGAGTLVGGHVATAPGQMVAGVTSAPDLSRFALIADPSHPVDAFSLLAGAGVNIEDIAQVAGTVSLTVQREDFDAAFAALDMAQREGAFTQTTVEKDVARVAIVGSGITNTPGVADAMRHVILDAGAQIDMMTTSETSISCLIKPGAKLADVVRALDRRFVRGEHA